RMVYSRFFFSSRRRHTRSKRDWSSDVCSSDLKAFDNEAGSFQPSGTNNARKLAERPDPTKAKAIKYSANSAQPATQPKNSPNTRSEERRVGKECKQRWGKNRTKKRTRMT